MLLSEQQKSPSTEISSMCTDYRNRLKDLANEKGARGANSLASAFQKGFSCLAVRGKQ